MYIASVSQQSSENFEFVFLDFFNFLERFVAVVLNGDVTDDDIQE